MLLRWIWIPTYLVNFIGWKSLTTSAKLRLLYIEAQSQNFKCPYTNWSIAIIFTLHSLHATFLKWQLSTEHELPTDRSIIYTHNLHLILWIKTLNQLARHYLMVTRRTIWLTWRMYAQNKKWLKCRNLNRELRLQERQVVDTKILLTVWI